MRWSLLLLVCLSFRLASKAAAEDVEFSYDGRAKSGGAPFNGTGSFKFAIVSEDGTICYWSNDGVTLTGNEPTSSVQIAVSNGFFEVTIGDTALNGMAPLEAAIFNADERLRLRVWFNDGVNGFQLMTPDRGIKNVKLIGLRDGNRATIYVNPVSGNDRFGGNRPNRAKRTIQAAWNALPKIVESTVTIQLAAGSYYQSARLSGRQVLNNAQIVLRGDPVSSNSVIISGAIDRATSTTPARDSIIYAENQDGLVIEGVRLEQSTRHSLHTRRCGIEVRSSQFYHTYFGPVFEKYSDATMANVSVDAGPGTLNWYGVVVHNSELDMINASFKGNAKVGCRGVLVDFHGVVYLTNTTIDNWYNGVHSKFGAIASVAASEKFPGGGNVIKNCTDGMHALNYGILIAPEQATYNKVIYTNVTTPIRLENGGLSGV